MDVAWLFKWPLFGAKGAVAGKEALGAAMVLYRKQRAKGNRNCLGREFSGDETAGALIWPSGVEA